MDQDLLKKDSNDNRDSNKNDDNVTGALDNYRDNTICLLACFANQWTGFYMIMASVMKELNKNMGRSWLQTDPL